ncbi:hypothetical protein PHMEG_00036653 [Phytophthora megakarya]|uniref:Uncharacterized protein n=1 Tax=Phytophthora megakarya TaxID=4795 RepID=A0A225ULI1_9STRA|nr:hypothetical protein PHMEG_00036653 [Phytophthora megakarya]
MQFAPLWIMLMAAFFVANLDFIAAESTASTNVKVSSPSDIVPDTDHKGRRLRRSEESYSEERISSSALRSAAHANMMKGTSTQSSQKMLQAVRTRKPLPRWAKVFIALLALGVNVGAVVLLLKGRSQ